jgi:hypothetical protein
MELWINQTWDGQSVGEDETVRLHLSWVGDDLLCQVFAPFHEDPAPSGPPGSFWSLWEQEVVEIFVLGEGEPAPYTEIEVGPHGHYLVLKLLGERNVVEQELPLSLAVAREEGRWTGKFCIPAEYLPPGRLLVNGYAIHGQGGERRYLVSTVLGSEEPNFHHLAGFSQSLNRG